MNPSFFRLLTLGAAVVVGASLRADPALVGHKALAGQLLDGEAIKAVLLGKKVTLGDTRVVIVIAKSNPNQERFLQQAVGMTTAQFQNHWRRLFMTGGGSAPKIVEDEAEARRLLAEVPGALAVVDGAAGESLVPLGTL
jgi:hypothetical protein